MDVNEKILSILCLLENSNNEKIEFNEIDFVKFFKYLNLDMVEEYFRELDKNKILNLEIFAEDGFSADWLIEISNKKELIKELNNNICSLNQTIINKDNEINKLKKENEEILNFNPEKVTELISKTKNQVKKIKEEIKTNDLLEPISGVLTELELYTNSVDEVNKIYKDVFQNIIIPIKMEGKESKRVTILWTFIGAIVGAIISIVTSIILPLIHS